MPMRARRSFVGMVLCTTLYHVSLASGGPGPAAYALPGTVGLEDHDPTRHRAPGYTMAGVQQRSYESVGPGPAHGVPQGMTRNGPAPHVGVPISGPWTILRTLSVPGPGAHRPEDFPPQGRRAPVYSLRFREGPRRKRGPAPAPIDYALPSCLGHHVPDKPSSPAYNMCHVPRAPKYAQTPGPDVYYPQLGRRGPHYTASGPNYPPGDKTVKPGPDTYLPPMAGRRAPRFSFGVRHSECINSPASGIDNDYPPFYCPPTS
ncbi:outer dense fiber protein 3-like [Schistocerca nitens]|uniref:outer dense fiber protein 3-like n=1 Tax=Schistocerca nitens TaxID=7011 RepID=UPI002118F7FC|nr:outer dense fiber protein 3-like [Schistocerca nitens]